MNNVQTYEEIREARQSERSALQPDPRHVTMQEAVEAYERQNTVTIDKHGGEDE